MKRAALIAFAFCFSFIVNAKDYSRIDKYAKTTPEIKTGSVSLLAHYLVAPAKNDSEKVRSIFSWMTSHIKYDWAAYENGTSAMQDPAYTLKQRKGVCQNFSDLFTALCNSVGLPAQTITGYAKSSVDDQWMFNGFASSNHAWNVVKINNAWQLMDVTWAACTGEEKYFMANPLIFRRNHLPSDPQWQLTKNVMKLEEYQRLPVVEDGYDEYSISNLTPMVNCIKGMKKIIIEFDSPADFNLKADIHNYDYKDKTIPQFTPKITHTGHHYRIEIAFASEKIYWLELYGNFFHRITNYIVDTHVPHNTNSR